MSGYAHLRGKSDTNIGHYEDIEVHSNALKTTPVYFYRTKWINETNFNAGTLSDTQVNGTGDAATVGIAEKADGDNNIPYAAAGNYTLSNGTKLEVASGVGKLKSAVGVNHNWPFTTAGNYTLSDAAKLEITGGVCKLVADSNRMVQYHLNESAGSAAAVNSDNG